MTKRQKYNALTDALREARAAFDAVIRTGEGIPAASAAYAATYLSELAFAYDEWMVGQWFPLDAPDALTARLDALLPSPTGRA